MDKKNNYDEKLEDIVRYENTHSSADDREPNIETCDPYYHKIQDNPLTKSVIFNDSPQNFQEKIYHHPIISMNKFSGKSAGLNVNNNIQKNSQCVNPCFSKSPSSSNFNRLYDNFNVLDSERTKNEDEYGKEKKKEKGKDHIFTQDDLIKISSVFDKKQNFIAKERGTRAHQVDSPRDVLLSDKTMHEVKSYPRLIRCNSSKILHTPPVKVASHISNLGFNVKKYKVNIPEAKEMPHPVKVDISDSDLDVELQGESTQITDFLKSVTIVGTLKHTQTATSPITKESGSDTELLYIAKLKKLQEENQELRLHIRNNPSKSTEIDEIKLTLDKKSRECVEYKSKLDTILFENEILIGKVNDLKASSSKIQNEVQEKENTILALRSEMRNKEETIGRLTEEISKIKNQLENSKSEISVQKEEMKKKSEKILECQQKISQLELEVKEVSSKANSELETFRENNKNSEALKMTYLDLKNQYDMIYLKLQSVNDENYYLKRDFLLTKNTAIGDQERELTGAKISNRVSGINNNNPPNSYLSSRSHTRLSSVDPSNLINRSNESSVMMNEKALADQFSNNINISTNTPTLSTSSTKGSLTQNVNSSVNHGRKRIKLCEGIVSNMSIFPSQREMVGKESKILEIETTLYNLQLEREKLSSELTKLPEFPKQKAQILKKKSLELAISEYNQKISRHKQELIDLNAFNRDY